MHLWINLKKTKWSIWQLESRLKYSMFFQKKVSLIKLTKLIFSHSWKSSVLVEKESENELKKVSSNKYIDNLTIQVREADSDNNKKKMIKWAKFWINYSLKSQLMLINLIYYYFCFLSWRIYIFWRCTLEADSNPCEIALRITFF